MTTFKEVNDILDKWQFFSSLQEWMDKPTNDLKKIQKYLWGNRDTIIVRWYQFFGV